MRRSMFIVAALVAGLGCSGAPVVSQTEVAVPGVASVPLTSPWKEMNLPIDGGVVVASMPALLTVDFPATPADGLPGLGVALRDALVAHGWSVVALDQDDSTSFALALRTDRGGDATLNVVLYRGRPRAEVSAF